MDPIVACSYNIREDKDLIISKDSGVAWQKDMSFRTSVPYFDKCSEYDQNKKEVADRIYEARLGFVRSVIPDDRRVLDIGAGSCEFVRRRKRTWGFDLDEKAQAYLKSIVKWSSDFGDFQYFTMFDVIEHVEHPNDYFRHMVNGSILIVTIPIFEDLDDIRSSKHYRPGEHLYYWTNKGFVDWMAAYGFRVLRTSSREVLAGRAGVESFALERVTGS